MSDMSLALWTGLRAAFEVASMLRDVHAISLQFSVRGIPTHVSAMSMLRLTSAMKGFILPPNAELT